MAVCIGFWRQSKDSVENLPFPEESTEPIDTHFIKFIEIMKIDIVKFLKDNKTISIVEIMVLECD